MSDQQVIKACYFGTYRSEYSRNRIMIDGLRLAGVEVIECHEPLWKGIEDRVEVASGGWIRPGFLWRLTTCYLRLLRKYRRIENFDVLIVGYPGQLDIFLARFLSRLKHKPAVWDIFMSIYLIALERGLDKSSPLTIKLIRGLEKIACKLPDRMILDTPEYESWFVSTYGLSPEQFSLVPTGADDRVYHPVEAPREPSTGFTVIYYGSFIRNHGVEYMIQAADLLREDPAIHFELIGDGPDKERALSLVRKLGLTNVCFVDWLDERDLVIRVARADVCLGAFGVTPQSLMTIQNKIYAGLAMAKPVITGDSPAISRSFIHREHLFICERANPASLAKAIQTLKDDPGLRNNLSQNGYSYYLKNFTVTKLGMVFKEHLDRVLSTGGSYEAPRLFQ